VSTIGLSRANEPVEALYREYSREVFALTRRNSASRADAEDASQTAFMNAHTALLHGVRPTNERAWLLAIARNVCRKRASRPREEPLDETVLMAPSIEEPAAGELREALERLLPRHRLALVLHDLEGHPHREVEARLGVTAAGLDALLFRARRALREELSAAEAPLACHESRALVQQHLEHTLDRAGLDRLRAHLRVCSDCAVAARRQRAHRRLPFGLPWWGALGRLLPRGARAVGDLKVGGAIGAMLAAGGAVAVIPASPVRHRAVPSHVAVHVRPHAIAHVLQHRTTPLEPSRTVLRLDRGPDVHSQASPVRPRATAPFPRPSRPPTPPRQEPVVPPRAPAPTVEAPAPAADTPTNPPAAAAAAAAPAAPAPPAAATVSADLGANEQTVTVSVDPEALPVDVPAAVDDVVDTATGGAASPPVSVPSVSAQADVTP
jgi:RNA polymerase sigma-70 factor, ECF subfamily